MVVLTFSVLEQKYSFRANLVQKFKIIEKLEKQLNHWIKVVLRTTFVKFKVMFSKCFFSIFLPRFEKFIFLSEENCTALSKLPHFLFFFWLLHVWIVWFCCWIYVIDIKHLLMTVKFPFALHYLIFRYPHFPKKKKKNAIYWWQAKKLFPAKTVLFYLAPSFIIWTKVTDWTGWQSVSKTVLL